MFKLRDYQQDADSDILAAWQGGYQNVLAVLPCGAGKTVLLAYMISRHKGASCVIAHRQELVLQISIALASAGVVHRIIGPSSVVRLAIVQHMAKLGKSFYNPHAPCGVAGIDTLVRRTESLAGWMGTVTMWVMDEAHHILTSNKWGTGAALFPRAIGLGVTATPVRADGAGLGRHADGVFDKMIVGPSMRDLINLGSLSDYRVFCPPCDIDLSEVKISLATGDYNQDGLRKAVHKSHLHGDVVSHYRKIAMGKLGITFAVDVEHATQITADYNAAGVIAELVTAKTTDADRLKIMERFRAKKTLQLVNVDLFGEGVDIPAIECVVLARPTASFGLFCQQFSRGGRLAEGKKFYDVIDAVGNVWPRHGLPDAPRKWSLDRRDRKASKPAEDVIPLKVCPDCTQVYERFLPSCPHCGFVPVPADRKDIRVVEGDLTQLDPLVLAAMRGEIEKVDLPATEYRESLLGQGIPQIGQAAMANRHHANQQAQITLRDNIAQWAGYVKASGVPVPSQQSYKMFYLKFGVDVLTAQALKMQDATELNNQIVASFKDF